MRMFPTPALITLAAGILVAVLGTPAYAATLPAGAQSLESVNFPGRYIRRANYLGQIEQVSAASPAQTKLDATFTIVNGLASPACYSLQTKGGLFLRHRNWRVRAELNTGDAALRADATFCTVQGSVAGSISLAAYNYPGHRIRRSDQYSGQMIDPTVFTDDDGRSYLYWGQGAVRVVPLNADMTSFDPAQVRVITPPGYNEAPVVFKRIGIYYFMWSENDTRSDDYRGAYATGATPLGPWTKRAVVLQKRLEAGIKGTGRHSVVRVPGTDLWHIAYHRFAVPAGDGTNRETAIDPMSFNADGTIRPIIPSL